MRSPRASKVMSVYVVGQVQRQGEYMVAMVVYLPMEPAVARVQQHFRITLVHSFGAYNVGPAC